MTRPLTLPTGRENVILRELSTDADDIVYYESYNASRPEIEVFDPDAIHKHRTLEDTRNARLTAGSNIRMGIWSGDTFVGSINARLNAEDVEVGYWTDSRHAGNGYATLATRALSGHLARRFSRVHAEVVEGNDASVHVLKKSGFRNVVHDTGRLIFEYSPITIEAATPQGLESLTDFMQQVYADTYPNERGIKREMFENDTFHGHLHGYLEEKLANPSITLLMAQDNHGVVRGTIGIEKDNEDETRAEVWGFYVDPSMQARGIGTELWESLMASDVVKPFNILTLTVAKDSKVATEFYKKHGFQIVDEEQWDWPSWTDEHLVNQYWIMQKDI